MVLNYIWIAFFVIAFIFALIGLAMGDTTIFQKIVDSTFDSSKNAFEISLGLTGVLALWLGIMKIGEKAGVVNVLARALSPVFTRLFPDIPKNHPVMGSIFMNIASNMLGLDNAATPTGLKAMQQMQELNTKKDTATNPMIMFLVLNRTHHHPYHHPRLPCLLRSSPAYGCLHPYPDGYARGYACRNHHHFALAAHQHPAAGIARYSVGNVRLRRHHHLGIRTDGQGYDEHGYHLGF